MQHCQAMLDSWSMEYMSIFSTQRHISTLVLGIGQINWVMISRTFYDPKVKKGRGVIGRKGDGVG